MKVGDSPTKTGPQALQPYEVIGGTPKCLFPMKLVIEILLHPK